jgi:hypothetical protein
MNQIFRFILHALNAKVLPLLCLMLIIEQFHFSDWPLFNFFYTCHVPLFHMGIILTCIDENKMYISVMSLEKLGFLGWFRRHNISVIE